MHITQQHVAPTQHANFIQRPTQNWLDIKQFPHFLPLNTMPLPQQAWYKVQWDYQCDQKKQPIHIVLSHLNMAGKIYFNDDLLWHDSSITEPLSRSWNTPHSFIIPASSIQPKNNTLWIYAIGTTTKPISIGHLHIAAMPNHQPFYAQYLFEQRTLILISFIINFIVGLFYFLAWLIYRQEKAFFWMTLSILFWISYNFLYLIQSTSLMSHQFERLITWVFSTYTLLGCLSIWRFADLRFAKIEKFLVFIFIINTIVLVITPLNYLPQMIGIIFMVSMLIFLARNLSYPFLIYKTKKIEVFVLAITHLCYVPISLHDAYQFITQQTNFWSPYVSPLSAIAIGMLLALRLSRNAKQIAQFNEHLQEQIQLATHEREIALNTQHQLAIENTKLQERMHLAHDLHDSLGGSLVRSMAIVNQSHQNLTNQQFLSMLKVLRDDLRQIIDSGASSSNTPPGTPQIWGAAIRYRFLQIFDALDIDSTWSLPPQWQHQPTTLECLTLLRIIEESLTNIIKHSQAKNVKVSLFYNDAQQLNLMIEDDGIGFNPQAAFNSGISIGLRSMQLRIEKIGATMNLESQAGKTLIHVITKLKSVS